MAVSNGGLGGIQSKAPGAPGPTGMTPTAPAPKSPAPTAPPTGLNGGHGAYGDTGNLGPGTAGGPLKPPVNGLAQFANSALGKYLSSQAAAPNAGNYMDAFQGALGSARSDIAQQLSGALADIKANQGYAQQALGQLPGQINTSYKTANALTDIGQRGAQAGMNAPGLNAATAANTGGTLNQYMAPERAAIAGEQAGELANVPLLGTGIQQAANQEAAAANNAALSDYGSLAQQQAQIAGQAQIAAMGQSANQQQQQNQNIFAMLQGAQNNQYTLRQIAAQNAANSGGSSTYSGLTQQQVAQVQSSPQYLEAVQAVQGGQYKTKADLQKAFPTNPALWQTVASQYGLA